MGTSTFSRTWTKCTRGWAKSCPGISEWTISSARPLEEWAVHSNPAHSWMISMILVSNFITGMSNREMGCLEETGFHGLDDFGSGRGMMVQSGGSHPIHMVSQSIVQQTRIGPDGKPYTEKYVSKGVSQRGADGQVVSLSLTNLSHD